jgi:predicted nucleotidyltransferase
MKQFDPEQYLIFNCVSGSKLYGTSTPESDDDIRGVCIPPMEVLLDPFMKFNVKDSFDGEDKAIYDLGKFMSLCADSNPNIVELLFVPEQNTLFTSPEWKLVVENKNLFLSKNVKHRFLGYAFAQLEAIKRHREWFIQPPDHKPTREEFGLKQTPLVSEGALQNVLAVSHELFLPEHHDELVRERAYRDAKKKWDNFQQWQKNRNPKRKGTEEKFGYDTKYASHLFRLMEEGKELLLTGNITFPLPKAKQLLEIKNGFLTYERVLTLASTIEIEFEDLYDRSILPHNPNRNSLKELYFEIVKGYNHE